MRSLYSRLALLSLSLVTITSSAHADPCEALLCMSAYSGNGTPPPACAAHQIDYLSHVIFRHEYFGAPIFDPIATRVLRHNFLMQCPGAVANLGWVEIIDQTWGMVPFW